MPESQPELATALAQLSGVLLSRQTVETALALVTRLAATTTRATTGAGVTVVDTRGRHSRAASAEVVERADALQYDLDQGPCLTAWSTGEVVRLDDTRTDRRWPRWSPGAAAVGVRSVLSAPLTVAGEHVGAMKVYSRRPNSYGAHDEQVMQLLAGQATILLTGSQSQQEARRSSRRLAAALDRRDTVAHAVGILLARGTTTTQEAFGRLSAAALQAGTTVELVARALVAEVTGADERRPDA